MRNPDERLRQIRARSDGPKRRRARLTGAALPCVLSVRRYGGEEDGKS